MVNTFLPYPEYVKSARDLDNKRLGKQRVEAYQILKVNLGLSPGKGWVNHPAAIMWRGYEGHLCEYAIAICDEWTGRGFKDSIKEQVMKIIETLPEAAFEKPWWLGIPEFHESHQSNLVRKDCLHYVYQIAGDKSYLWPRSDRTLKTKEQIHEDKVLLQNKQGGRKRRSVVSDSKRKGTGSTKRRVSKTGTRKRMVKSSSR